MAVAVSRMLMGLDASAGVISLTLLSRKAPSLSMFWSSRLMSIDWVRMPTTLLSLSSTATRWGPSLAICSTVLKVEKPRKVGKLGGFATTGRASTSATVAR